MDYRRAPLGHDTHSGTDFALTARARMARDVDVPPATPGTVRGARDGIRDVVFTTDQTDAPGGRDCGNGVAIDHGGGWTTRYCHLEKGSIRIKTGDRVRMATVLGQIGRSGRTRIPQLHMTLRKDGQAVGPFDPDGRITCDTPGTDILWLSPPPGPPGRPSRRRLCRCGAGLRRDQGRRGRSPDTSGFGPRNGAFRPCLDGPARRRPRRVDP